MSDLLIRLQDISLERGGNTEVKQAAFDAVEKIRDLKRINKNFKNDQTRKEKELAHLKALLKQAEPWVAWYQGNSFDDEWLTWLHAVEGIK